GPAAMGPASPPPRGERTRPAGRGGGGARPLYGGGSDDAHLGGESFVPSKQRRPTRHRGGGWEIGCDGRAAQRPPQGGGVEMTAASLGGALSVWLAGIPVVLPWSQLSTEERTEAIQTLHAKPIDQRIVEASGRFLEVPYVYSPLGEGEGKDADPTLRFDAAD